jgi:hypothetical protein
MASPVLFPRTGTEVLPVDQVRMLIAGALRPVDIAAATTTRLAGGGGYLHKTLI